MFAAVLGMDSVFDSQLLGIPKLRFHWLSLAEAGEPMAYPEIRNSWTSDGTFTVEVWNDLYGPTGEWILQCKTNGLLEPGAWMDIPPVISNTAVLPIVLTDTNTQQSTMRFYRVLRRVASFP